MELPISKEDLPKRRTKQGYTICFIGTCYDAFLTNHYQAHPEYLQANYQTQLDGILGTGFGDADFYSRGMRYSGWHAVDLIANCTALQSAWARENAIGGGLLDILVAQVKQIQPDVIYIQNIALGTPEFLARLRPHTKLIVGQIASPLPTLTHLPSFDILISSFPHFVEQFRATGICSYYQPLAFDSQTLSRLGPRKPVIPFSFVGGISGSHAKGLALLTEVATRTPLQMWGYGADTIPNTSILKSRHQGEAWGLDMFRLLQNSFITLNRHIDVAGNFANNMRLFEATGVGAMLITDYKDNLCDLFEIGKEVAAYRSAGECAELVNYYLQHPKEAEEIALAGQQRTLNSHSYSQRMEQTTEILERHLLRPSLSHFLGTPGNVSHDYQSLDQYSDIATLSEAWKDPHIPIRQRALVETQLEDLYSGKVNPLFKILADLLRAATYGGQTVLEIGCSSGYYFEILEYLLCRRIAYSGVDYSESMVTMAREIYPKAEFIQADGANLPFGDHSFHCVVSSCILLHTVNYLEHIRETVRVAKAYVVVHRTPICRLSKTQVMKKKAYDVETVELRFNETEIVQAFISQGMILDQAVQYISQPELDRYEISYRFRFPHSPRLELGT